MGNSQPVGEDRGARDLDRERRVAAIVVVGLLAGAVVLWWVDRGLSCAEWHARMLDATRSMWGVGSLDYRDVGDVYVKAGELHSERPRGCEDPPSQAPWDIESQPGWWLWEPAPVRAYEEAHPPPGEGS